MIRLINRHSAPPKQVAASLSPSPKYVPTMLCRTPSTFTGKVNGKHDRVKHRVTQNQNIPPWQYFQNLQTLNSFWYHTKNA